MKTAETLTKKTINFILLTVTLVTGLLILLPFLEVQPVLLQGDHGRDLYVFGEILKGAKPYQDFWWVYGPLMPSYYSLFFKMFGIQIKSILFGQMLLNLGSGILIFLLLRLFISPLMSSFAAMWFWVFNEGFHVTYNHAGGIFMSLAVVYILFLYLKNQHPRNLYLALLMIFILSMIKVNFGLAALFSFLISTLYIDIVYKIPFSKLKFYFYVLAIGVLPFIIFLIYSSYVEGLPFYAIRQCFPYFVVDHPNQAAISNVLIEWGRSIFKNFTSSPPNLIFGLIIQLSILQSLFQFLRSSDTKTKKQIFLMVSIIVLFYITYLHEFLVSGVTYRTFWARPFSILLIFIFLSLAIKNYSRLTQNLILAMLLVLATTNFMPQFQSIKLMKIPRQHLWLQKADIYTANPPSWINTVTKTTQYLENYLKKDETFFALPYLPLYYYLTDRTNPTRLSIFFEHINITTEQEVKIIQDLTKNKVDYIVVSNRIKSAPTAKDVLNLSHYPILNRYLNDQFEVVKTIGDWNKNAGFIRNHATKILKKIQPSIDY